MQSGIELVRAWHDAANRGDTERFTDLVTDDVEIAGPQGSAHGRDVLIDWVGRTGIRLTPTEWYQRDGTVIVGQQAQWPDDTGTPGDPIAVATVFTVHEDRIVRIARYSELGDAFAATGLSERDKVSV